ncbi:MAG: hypothetical protein GC185_06340 [Alphaproteobacteria bacterium]|nr:hypothetical protein [Alphaproteobacteria bacterium]
MRMWIRALESSVIVFGVLLATAAMADDGSRVYSNDFTIIAALGALITFFIVEVWWATSSRRLARKARRHDSSANPSRHSPTPPGRGEG